MGPDSGTGVAFTRDPASGENVFYGEFLMNAQGEDVVAGTRTPLPISELERENPKIYGQLMFEAISPVVSVVSSGDESARKEYIHPRATLVGALGKWSRVPEPLVFITELVAFFNVEGYSRLADEKKATKRGTFFGFSRTAFGLVKTRTDGKRLLVYTDSGNVQMKEAYAYALDSSGVPQPALVARA